LIASRFAQVTAEGDVLAINTQFLMSGFNDGQIQNMAGGYSPLGLLSVPLRNLGIPLVVLGISYSIGRWQVHANLFLIWLVATIPIFFLFPLNINRANALFLPLIALSAIGMSGLYASLDKKYVKMAVLSIVLIAVTIYNSMFCLYYFKNYNNDAKDNFTGRLDIALRQARSFAFANEPMYVSNRILGNYQYILVFLKIDPVDFQKHSHVIISNGAYQILSYRNYYFFPDETELTSAPSFVAILKGNEQLSCGHTQILYSEEGWTIERCFQGLVKEVG
jgi:hypothetical protein